MNTALAHDTLQPDRAKFLSPLMLSVVAHVLGILTVLLIVPKVMPDGTRHIPERAVGIVLSQPMVENKVAYFRDSQDADATTSPAAASSQSAPPVRDFSEVPPELQLPRAVDSGNSAVLSSVSAVSSSKSTGVPTSADMTGFIADEQSRLRANRPVGEPAAMKLFGGHAANGRKFIFLIDRSKSMGGEGLGALTAVERELEKAITVLAPHHQFQVVAYHHQCVFLTGRRELLPATSENVGQLKGFVQNLAAFGATEHEMGLSTALYLEPDVIYLLTDGGDPHLTPGQVRKIAKLAGGRTQIHAIRFGFGPLTDSDPTYFLNRLAAETGGSSAYVDMAGRR